MGGGRCKKGTQMNGNHISAKSATYQLTIAIPIQHRKQFYTQNREMYGKIFTITSALLIKQTLSMQEYSLKIFFLIENLIL